MADLVSPCCGDEYTDNENGSSYCCDAELFEGICLECKEHSEPEIGLVCMKCEEFFGEAIEDYEYAEQQHDSYLEDRMDAERDER